MTKEPELKTALVEVLNVYGDPKGTAAVVARARSLPHDEKWVQSVAAIAREVWERKLAVATARAEKANKYADDLTAMNTLSTSAQIH